MKAKLTPSLPADRHIGTIRTGNRLPRASREKKVVLDRRKLTKAETWAHLAIADNQVFVRELNAMVVYTWSAPSTLVSGQNGGKQ